MWTSLYWGINLCVLGVPLIQVHWDLRDQYLGWADNWFPATDVWDPPQALRQLLSKETWATKKAAEYVWEMLLQNFKLASCTIYPMIRVKKIPNHPFTRMIFPETQDPPAFLSWSGRICITGCNLRSQWPPTAKVAPNGPLFVEKQLGKGLRSIQMSINHRLWEKYENSLMNMRWCYNAMIWYGAVVFAITFFEGASTRYILGSEMPCSF